MAALNRIFIPAAGSRRLTAFYDFGIAVFTRENYWRNALVNQLNPGEDDVIADIGCGTGSLLLRLGARQPRASLIGIDPDRKILERARLKAKAAAVNACFIEGYARDATALLGQNSVNKIASSLAFHHMPMEEKRAAMVAMYDALIPGGEIHVADFGLQRTCLMRALFRISVQTLDGRETTESNARGVLPKLMMMTGFKSVAETLAILTPFGSISLYRGIVPIGPTTCAS